MQETWLSELMLIFPVDLKKVRIKFDPSFGRNGRTIVDQDVSIIIITQYYSTLYNCGYNTHSNLNRKQSLRVRENEFTLQYAQN